MKWHHSLYWRIAAGFVASLALLLVVQALLFVWMLGRSRSGVSNQPPERFAQAVALDVEAALQRTPTLDVAGYIRQEYSADSQQPFFVLLKGQSPVEIGGPFPNAIVEESRTRFELMERGGGRSPGERFERDFPGGGPGGDREPPNGEPFGRGGPPPPDRDGMPPGPGGGGRMGRGGPSGEPSPFMFGGGRGRPRPNRPARIVANGQLVGVVVVPPQPPFGFVLGRYAPTLGLVAVATLIVGALLATVAIFGPARSRLRAVEDAARRLGGGDLTARAPAVGNDEVAAMASAFNSMADDLAARAEALAASDRARRQLLADVSHELTTPVTAMRGYIETLTMPDMALDAETRARYLHIVGDETGRLERIIGDLLDLARLEGGGGSLRPAPTHVVALFDRVVARHARDLERARVSMITNIAGDAESVTVDPDRLEQALQNLAANALRYAPPGSAIVLGSRRDRDAIVLSVTDEGPGIPADHLKHVFDRFYKVDGSRAIRPGTAGGSGLGLSIVKAIVERHGGTVSVDSRPGRTRFELRIRN